MEIFETPPRYNPKKIRPVHRIHWPLTPYQLFSPVSSVFLNNLTQEEQILGLYKLYNDFVKVFNQLLEEYIKLIDAYNELYDHILQYDDVIRDLQEAMVNLQNYITNIVIEIMNKILEGDQNTLKEAKDYTDSKLGELEDKIESGELGGGFGGYMYGGLTAAEYDAMQWTATDYESMDWTAIEYDTRAKYVLFGEDGTIYLQFKETVTANELENVFDLANPPVVLGRRYQVEISLGNFTGGDNGVAQLEIVGENTLGNDVNINVPAAGFASVVIVPTTAAPTAVRVRAGASSVTGSNAYIKIKPLGEYNGSNR